MNNRFPYRFLLFSLPFPSIAVLRLGGFGLQFVHVAFLVAAGTLVVLALRERKVRASWSVLAFATGMLVLIVVGFVRVALTDVVPHVSPPYPSEAGQAMYWVTVVGFLVVANLYTERSENLGVVYRDWLWFAAGTAVVVIVGTIEFLVPYVGFPFPYDLVYSNPSFDHNWRSVIAGINRFTATFPEPSMLALYGTTALGVLYGLRRRILLAIFLVALGLSLSTSAVIGVGVFFLALLLTGDQFVRRHLLPVVAVIGVVAIVAIAVVPDLQAAVYETTIGKLDSLSFRQRLQTLLSGVRAWLDAPVLGWGIGSARTFDGFTMLLVNFGAVGTLWILGFFLQTLRVPRKSAIAHGLWLAVVAGVAVHLVSNPDWTFPFVWVIAGAIWALPSVSRLEQSDEGRT